MGRGLSWPWHRQRGSVQQVSGLQEPGEDLSPLTLPSFPLDPSLVAFLRSPSHTHEQAGEKTTEQRPGGHSVEVTGEEPIVPTFANEPRQEDDLDPGAPGLDKRGHLWGNKSRGKYPFF